jgi:hypothetical protein
MKINLYLYIIDSNRVGMIRACAQERKERRDMPLPFVALLKKFLHKRFRKFMLIYLYSVTQFNYHI